MIDETPEPGNSSAKSTEELVGQPLGCQPSLEEIYRYMDGYMDETRQAAVQSHFSHCPGCDDFYHFHTGLRNLIGQRCRTEPPSTLSQRIFEAIADQRSDPLA